VPSDQRVMVLEPNGCVCPVIDFPSRDLSVVMLPLPKGCVRLEEPSERWVSVPEPNFCVVPDRGALWLARGGVGSAACTGGRHPAARRLKHPSQTPRALHCPQRFSTDDMAPSKIQVQHPELPPQQG